MTTDRTCEVVYEDDYGITHSVTVTYRPAYQFRLDDEGFYQPERVTIEIITIQENGMLFSPELSDLDYIKEACREDYMDEDWEYAEN